MDLAALFAFVAVVARTRSALRHGLLNGAVENDRARVGIAALGPAQQFAQIVVHPGKDPGVDPAHGLLVAVAQGGKLVGNMRDGAPARTIKRVALNTSRRSYRRCGASGVIRVRYGSDRACGGGVHFPSPQPTKSITRSRAAQEKARKEARREATEKELRSHLYALYVMQPAATEADLDKAYLKLREEHLYREAIAAPGREKRALVACGNYGM